MGLNKPLAEITEEDLQELVDTQVSEQKVIDYKLELKISSDADRKEFLYDVASLATAAGGHLIFGIEEAGGYPQKLVGVDVADEDALILQVESIIRTGIAPRPRAEVVTIPLTVGKNIVMIRVAAGWAKPYMVTYKGTNKFYGRDSRGKYPLDVHEIRAAVALGETVAERARQFRIERLAAILAGQTSPRLDEGPTTIVHLVPLEAFHAGSSAKTLPRPDELAGLRPMRSSGWNPMNNFEGIVCHGGAWGGDEAPTYVQVFRNGIIESAATWSSPLDRTRDFPSIAYERDILAAIPTYLKVQWDLGVEPPILVMISLARMTGLRMAVSPQENMWGEDRVFDRSELSLPEGVLDSFDQELGPELKPLFDIVWNTVGFPRSLNFDADGNWVDRR